MNVMWLHDDLHEAAKAHPTKYTKLILEAAQCLCSALHNNGLADFSPYGAGYKNHPISRWAGESQQNWFQLIDYMSALHEHYYGYSYEEIRDMEPIEAWSLWYKDRAIHKSVVQIAQAPAVEQLVRKTFPDVGLTARPKCVFDFCKCDDVVETYRKYIVCIKSNYDWFEWSAGKPEWYDDVRAKYFTDYRRGKAWVALDQSTDNDVKQLVPKPL